MPVAPDLRTEWLDATDTERARREAELLARGLPLPLYARGAWARAFPGSSPSVLVVHDASGPAGALALESSPTRALPGHVFMRARRAGRTLGQGTEGAAVAALVAAARSDPRVLRVTVENFSPDAAERARFGSALEQHGFRRTPPTASYESTLVVDLRGRDDAGHLAALSYNTRRKIRAVAKFPAELRPVTDPALSPRMNALVRETFTRTGAVYTEQDYAPVIRLAAESPGLSRIAGLFRTDLAGPDALLAFAWGAYHGDHVAYDVGASTRPTDPELAKLPVGHALIWDLLCWARAQGASWFDLGGITEGTKHSDDPLGGISDFKRGFSTEVVQVAEEWVFTPHPMRDALATAVSRGARVLDRLRGAARG